MVRREAAGKSLPHLASINLQRERCLESASARRKTAGTICGIGESGRRHRRE